MPYSTSTLYFAVWRIGATDINFVRDESNLGHVGNAINWNGEGVVSQHKLTSSVLVNKD